MNRPFLLIIALGALLFAGCNDKPSSDRIPPGDYFPLVVGDSWTYRMAPGTKIYEAKVTASRMVGSTKTYAMAVEETYSYLVERPDGVYQYGQGDPSQPTHAVLFDPPQLVYKLPFHVGDSWETPVLSEPTQKKSETVYVDGQVDSLESVKVPAGEFRCVRVTVDDPRDSPADRTDLWFAPNVGIVKTVTYIAVGAGKPKTTTTELLKYRLSNTPAP